MKKSIDQKKCSACNKRDWVTKVTIGSIKMGRRKVLSDTSMKLCEKCTLETMDALVQTLGRIVS